MTPDTPPTTDRPFLALSLGMGQQSTAIAIASALRLTIDGYAFPQYDAMIFAETLSESQATNDHVERFGNWLADHGQSVTRVRGSQIRKTGMSLGELIKARSATGQDSLATAPQIPAFVKNADGSRGRLMKDCTYDLKSRELDAEAARQAKKVGKRYLVEQHIGFGIEEVHRMKMSARSKEGWTNDFPLIRAKMNRGAAKGLCEESIGYAPPPSACTFCPFRGVDGWRALRDNSPEEFDYVVSVDEAIRDSTAAGIERPVFLSDQLVPVAQAIERDDPQLTLFGGTCDDGGCWT